MTSASTGEWDLDELLESSRSSTSYVQNDEEQCPMKKTIVVYGLPGPQAGSVCRALLGNPLFHVRGVFNKECPEIAQFLAMGVETEVLEVSDKGPISIVKLNHIFRDAYGAFIVSNDSDPPLVMRREMEIGIKLAELCQRTLVKHVVFSAVDFVFRITGQRCPRYDGKGEIEHKLRSLGVPLTVLKLPLSIEYLVNTLLPHRQGSDYVFTGVSDSNRNFDIMNYADVGPVVKIAFERPNIFVGKTIGLTVERIDIDQFVQEMSHAFKDDSELGFRYERTTQREYQKDKKNNRELATLLDFHCNYAPLRDGRTMRALNPDVQTFSEYVSANKTRIGKLFKII